MQEKKVKLEYIYDPNQLFPIPYTLISNIKKTLTSLPLKQPFAYEVYCPISCKKVKIGVAKENTKEGIQFNTTSSRWVSVHVNNNIKYLVNEHNPVKKDKKKAQGENWSIYLQVQDKGNYAIFNPFYVDPSDPLSFYTFNKISKAFKPEKKFAFLKNQDLTECEQIKISNKILYLRQNQRGVFISHNKHFEDEATTSITLLNPLNREQTIKGSPQEFKKIVDENLAFWLWNLNQIFINQESGKSQQINFNLDQIYQNLSFYLNIDEQIRRKLMNSVGIKLLKQLYKNQQSHPRLYSEVNRLISFFNYGNTKYDVKKLAAAGFYNKSDMLQDIAFMEFPHVPIPNAEQSRCGCQINLRERLFPMARVNRKLAFPNVQLKTSIQATHPQTITTEKIIYKDQSNQNYLIFVDSSKKLTLWTSKILVSKLLQLDLVNPIVQQKQLIFHQQLQAKVQQNLLGSVQINDPQSLADIFGEIDINSNLHPKDKETEAQIIPDQSMVDQLLAMGYGLNIVKKALIKVKNESVPIALDQIEKITAEQKAKFAAKKAVKTQWSCQYCTYVNSPTADSCQICNQIPNFQDIEQLERLKKQQEQQKKAQQQKKIQESKRQQQKLQAQKLKKQKQEEQAQILRKKEQFYSTAQISSVKLFKTPHSAIDPFIFLVLFTNKVISKSILKIIRVGYNRTHLTKFYRYQEGVFVSNLTRSIHPKKDLSILPINQIIKQSWDRIQNFNRLIEPFHKNEFIIVDAKQFNFEQIWTSIKLNQQSGIYMLQNQEKKKSSCYQIKILDDLTKTNFETIQAKWIEDQQKLLKVQKQNVNAHHSHQHHGAHHHQDSHKKSTQSQVIKALQGISFSTQIKLPSNASQVTIQAIQHLPSSKWKSLKPYANNFLVDTKLEGEVVMSQYLPLAIQHFDGSVFSSKYYSTSILQRSNLYISNYPEASFTFKSLASKPMMIQTVTVISTNKRLQKIFPVHTGLIFTGNQISWFEIAKKKFKNFKKKQYEQWLNTKKDRNGYREFWQPVGFFQIQNQVQIQLDYKRTANYIFLLPTSVRTTSDKIDIAALKIDFFGVKGRIEEEISQNYQNPTNNFKSDCESYCEIEIKENGNKLEQNSMIFHQKSGTNTLSFLPTHSQGFNQIPLSVSTVYNIKFLSSQHEKTISINSPYLKKVTYKVKDLVQSQKQKEEVQIKSYKQLVDLVESLTQRQIQHYVQKFQTRQLLQLLLNNFKTFRPFEKLLKIIIQIPNQKERLFQSMTMIIPELCEDNIKVCEHGLKTFLRTFDKLYQTNNDLTFKTLCKSWKNITLYIQKIRNKNYIVLRNKYSIQQLILEPNMFSKDYYRLIHPSYVEDQTVVSTIVAQPKTQLNNLYYLHKLNPFYYKSFVDIRQQKFIQRLKIYFPKINQPVNRYKLMIKVYILNDQISQRLVYYRYFNQQTLVQFSVYAFKENQIYSQNRINYLTIPINHKGRVLRIQYNYLLLTTLSHLKYKEPTEQLVLFPIVQSKPLAQYEKKHEHEHNHNHKHAYEKVEQMIVAQTFPQQVKHSTCIDRLPPFKYTTQGQKSLYNIHEFPILNQESISKEYSQMVDKVTTNIMDKAIIDECLKSIKISNYQFNKKGTDFGYTLMINLMKVFKKLSTQYSTSVQLLLNMFDTFVIYQIGPIHKKVMGFISQVYKRLTSEEKCEFVQKVIQKYLTNMEKIQNLKQNQKYSLSKVIEKLSELSLPIAHLIHLLAESKNNKLLKSSLLKLIKPNIQKFNIVNLDYVVSGSKKTYNFSDLISISFNFCLWVLDEVKSVKKQMLLSGLQLLLTLMTGKNEFVEKNKQIGIKQFINKMDQNQIWKLVFLTLKLKNQELKNKIHSIFTMLIENTTQKFSKGINLMLLQIIKKDKNSIYSKINGEVSDQIWMNHLQTILEYLNITNSTSGNKKQFFLDIDTSICLLQLPLTQVLWSLVLLIIPRDDKILISIIKNFKKQFYSSLGKEITKFCQPLAGIRSLQTIHVNWLDLVKKIRLQGFSVFELFLDELNKCWYGGKDGLTMATLNQIKQLQITVEFSKLTLEQNINQSQYTEDSINKIISWYYLNSTTEKGISPATEKLKTLSENVLKIIQKFNQISTLVPLCIKIILIIKKESECMQGLFQQKHIPTHTALSLNKRFCTVFEQLLNIFMTTDQLSSYFAFDIKGLDYIMSRLNLSSSSSQKISINSINNQQIVLQDFTMEPEQEFLMSNGLMSKNESEAVQLFQIKSVNDLKQEQFANTVKLVPNMNNGATTATIDWTVYKKGTKTKIIYLSMVEKETYFEFPLYIQLGRQVQVRSIKIGFPFTSFQFTDKLIVSPSMVTIEGSNDLKNFQPLGQMNFIEDDGYMSNGVKVFALNLQKIRSLSSQVGQNHIGQSIRQFQTHRVKYLKIVIKRPIVSFIQGQYSPLNGKYCNAIGVNICFLSVIGDDVNKLPPKLVDSCKEQSKKVALTLLSTLLTQANASTMKRISNQENFSHKFKQNFSTINQLMGRYKQTVPQIIYSLGSNNQDLGDWLIEQFIKTGKEQTQGKIINQIIISTPNKIHKRINYFQVQLFKKLQITKNQSQIQSSLLFNRLTHFMQSFCKTIEECYETELSSSGKSSKNITSPSSQKDVMKQRFVLDCNQEKINTIIDIYDRKYSSPQIKSLVKMLIALIWIKKPLQLTEQVKNTTLDIIWKNCSQSKPYFYTLMSSLLVSRECEKWISLENHKKTGDLISQIKKSISTQNQKALKSQIFLLSILSYHQRQYLRNNKVHLELYDLLKVKCYADFQIYESLLKIIQNSILGYPQEEQKLASIMIKDVELLVRRKDPILQKLFVGILALQRQVMINIKGIDLKTHSSKKVQYVNSKILNRAQQKAIAQVLGSKKLKYTLTYQTTQYVKSDDKKYFVNSLYANQVLLIFAFSHNKNVYHCGMFCSAKPIKNQEEQYCWEEEIMSDKTSFFFVYAGEGKNTEHQYLKNNVGQKMLSIYECDEEDDHNVTAYHNGNEIFKFSSDPTNAILVSESILNKGGNTTAMTRCELISLQLFECKPATSGVKSDKKVFQFLSKSNQAKSPFTWYRFNQIYLFPGNISLNKLQKLLSLKASTSSDTSNSQQKNLLTSLEDRTDDFIVDINVNGSQQFLGQEQFGYIPKMNIFDCFSRLNGLNQVLKLGSASIKQWKNVQRKKNFEHYMEELKSFIHLPNFFSLFIKNHQYVTFLFEVASGMPDDTNSTRNWQEQEVNSSRFIYKILSDIFKFDRSAALRNMDTYNDFCDIILDKLAQISKQVPRVFKEQIQAQSQVNELGFDKIQKKKSEQNKKRKKKGTGYGADNQNNNSKWSSTQWLQNKKLRSQQILRVVSIIVSFLDCQTPLEDQRISQTLKSSCLLPLIQSSLRSGSLLDISKEADLFKNYLVLIRNIAKNPATVECLIQIQKNYKPEQTQSIHALLNKLHNISQIFLECLKSGKSAPDADQTTQSIAVDIQMTFAIIDKAVKKMKKNQNVMSIKQINEMPLMQAYRLLLSNLRFGYINLKKSNTSTYEHAHATSITGVSPSTQKILRLSQELADLSSSLPCQHTNSIFVRCDKSRIDVIKVLIMGSKDTPYSNGAFMFDVFCDDSYPNNPPKMLITTTGQGKIRFNPNLYSCGKVCLSLLGTWRGLASQNWDPKLSTLLQLFISTQGITMSEDVYFNEPGFDGQQGTDQGQKKNQAYSNIVRLGNVRHAMIDQIKNPPKGFQDVINRHFYIKRKQILEQCQKWLEYAQKRQASYSGLVADHNNSWCAELKTTKTKYKQLLQIQVKTLRQLLAKLPQPNLKQKDQEEQIKEQSAVKKKKHREGKDVKFGQIDVAYDKKQNQKEQKIQEDVMQDRWSRYIGAMGLEAVKKQASSNVLLLGLKPLGLEIAKNLILSGLAKLTIVQNEIISGHEEHFYMSDMKGKKIQDCIFKLKELNPYMIVDHRQTFPQLADLKKYNLVVSTLNINQSLKISQICRAQSIKFIYTQTCGVYGNYFADLGKSFQINDSNGEQPFEGLIQSISCDQKGVVKLLDGVRHPYEDGDYIVINKVQGMELIKQQMEQISQAQEFYNKMIQTAASTTTKSAVEQVKPSSINGKLFKIKVLNWNSFSIGDTTNFTPYIRNGLCKNIKIPKKVQYKPFSQCSKDFQKYLDPNMGIYDFQKMGDNLSIYVCFTALSKFVQQNKRRPNNWNIQDCQQFVKIVQQMIQPYKKSQEQQKVILEFAQKFSSICEAELPSIGAYLGGLVSQQVIKALTNKYTPINQFFTFQLNQLIQKVQNSNKESWKNHKIDENQPFRNIKIVVGKENMKKIEEMNLFVVGAGAIGCELLKNFAMVNMSAQGKMTVTDPDHIETSNLTRQFLFRQKHVKNPKSATASATLIQMNPNLKNHIVARLDKVCEQTEDIYSDEFFKKQTIIANALDNVKARQYVDKRCVVNKIPLFESGTLGPKGHVQVIVPYKTQNYGSQADPSQQAQIPHCTLKMFPEDTTHCIQWSRDIFGKIFTLDPKALKKVIQSKDTTSLQGKQKQTIIKMIKYHPITFEDCINQAVRIFFKHFRNNIRQLLYTYPIDMKTKEGKLFWTLPKRPPQQISNLDAKDQMHRTFIASYAVLFAKIFSIPTPKDFRKSQGKDRIMEHAIQVKIEDFVPSAEKSKQLQELTDKQQKNKQEQIIEEEHMAKVKPFQQVPQKQEEQIKLTSNVLELSIMPEQFEKDEDSNGHIDLIYSMSNLRARNYELAECTWIEAKLKAGRIMAALSTTTSVVAALQAIQIIKLVTGSQIWRNAFVNLAVPLIQISEPGPAIKQKIGNTQFSVWQDWQFKAPTLKDLLLQIEQKYQVEGFNISTSQGKPIYWEAMYKQKQQAKQALLTKSLKSLLGHGQRYQLNILMRNPKQKQKIFEKVPKVVVYPS